MVLFDSCFCTLRLEDLLTMGGPWPWQSKDMGYGPWGMDAKDQHVSHLPWMSYLQILCLQPCVSVPAMSTSCWSLLRLVTFECTADSSFLPCVCVCELFHLCIPYSQPRLAPTAQDVTLLSLLGPRLGTQVEICHEVELMKKTSNLDRLQSSHL